MALNVWEAGPAMPTAVRYPGSAFDPTTGRIWQVGGYTTGNTKTTQYLDTATQTWSSGGSLADFRSRNPVAGVDNGVVVVAGGYSSAGYKNTWEKRVGTTWTQQTSTMSSLRGYAMGGVHAGYLYVFGGEDGTNVLATCERVNISTGVWEARASMPAVARNAACVKDSQGNFWIIGGYNGTNYLSTVWRFNTAANTWSTGFADIPQNKFSPNAGIVADKIYVFGGYDSRLGTPYLTDTHKYDISTNTWTVEDSLDIARSSPGAEVDTINNRIYAFGGNDATVSLASVEIYTPNLIADSNPPQLTFNQIHGTGVADDIFRSAGFNAANNTLTISGTSSDAETEVQFIEVVVDGGEVVLATGTTSWSYVIDVSMWTAGQHTIQVTAIDVGGNSTQSTQTVWYSPYGMYGAAPTAGQHLTPLSPATSANPNP